jgi:hypothetical protein
VQVHNQQNLCLRVLVNIILCLFGMLQDKGVQLEEVVRNSNSKLTTLANQLENEKQQHEELQRKNDHMQVRYNE